MDRDIGIILEKYANEVYTNVAMARRGWDTEKKLRDSIDIATQGEPEARELLHSSVDLLLNRNLKVPM